METSKPKSTLVIGGTSHAGKSTLAERLCPPDGRILHTDTLGPHPGRPWPMPGKPVKPHVAAHYRELDVPELIAHVLRHYEQNIWPQVVRQVDSNDPPTMVEGSANCPGFSRPTSACTCVFVTVDPEVMRQRMWRESGHGHLEPDGQLLVEKFYARAIAFQERMAAVASQENWTCVDVSHADPEDAAMSVREAVGW